MMNLAIFPLCYYHCTSPHTKQNRTHDDDGDSLHTQKNNTQSCVSTKKSVSRFQFVEVTATQKILKIIQSQKNVNRTTDKSKTHCKGCKGEGYESIYPKEVQGGHQAFY